MRSGIKVMRLFGISYVLVGRWDNTVGLVCWSADSEVGGQAREVMNQVVAKG